MEKMLEQAIRNLKITNLNEMQQESLLKNKGMDDCVLLSPTGSGKTLAFLLPMLYQLKESIEGVQGLIITPTRELTIQIEEVFRKMGVPYKVNASYGGHSMKVEKNNFSQVPAVLIGTPGRICDHIRRENVDLSTVHTLVLDEFDKSLEMGFQEQMEFILDELKRVRKKILVSATEMDVIPDFTKIVNPIEINYLAAQKPAISLRKVVSATKDKLEALLELICHLSNEPTIVFSNHREPVERIAQFLTDAGIVNTFFHGGLDQHERERALIKFRNGSVNYLVSTDLGSRGLDIPEIKYIIHYHLPHTIESFVHRNGRTARMSATGTSFLLLSNEEEIPEYVSADIEVEKIGEDLFLPEEPEWETVYFSAGKKDKINKIDLVGFLAKKGNLKQDQIGLIVVQDFTSFVAVKRSKVRQLLKDTRDEKIKGKKVRIGISK